jgi:Protein of unknown function (DUF3822)
MISKNAYIIKDDRFTIDQIDFHEVFFEISINRFKFYLLNTKNETIVWLEDHFLGLQNTLEEFSEKIKIIITSHEFLAARFWKNIYVDFLSPFLIQIPKEFKDLNEKHFLEIAFPKLPTELFEIGKFEISNVENLYIWAFPKIIKEELLNIYLNREINVQPLIEKLISKIENEKRLNKKNQTLFHFDDLYLTIIQADTNNYLNVEVFPTKNIISRKEWRIALENAQNDIIMTGEITTFSSFYKNAKSINQKVEIGNTIKTKKLSQYFMDLPIHRYFGMI